MSTTATLMRLLDTVSDHLHAFPQLPAGIFSIQVEHNHSREERAVIHLSGCTLPPVAAALRAWADTLTEVSLEVWRPPAGTTVHLTVHGQLPGGLTVEIYSGVPYTGDAFGPIEPGDHHDMPIGHLADWAATGNGGVA